VTTSIRNDEAIIISRDAPMITDGQYLIDHGVML
jgi:hypothetical protein